MRCQIFRPCALLAALIAPAAAFYSPINASIRRTDVRNAGGRAQQTKLHFANELTLASEGISTVSTLPSLEVTSLLSTDNIKVAFSVATFLPQIFWLFLILIVST